MTVVVVRYLIDGRLDGTFGNGGIVLTNFTQENDNIRRVVAVAVNAQDQVTVVATGNDLHVARYLENGSLNPAFGQGGRINVMFPFQPNDAVIEIREQVIENASIGPIGNEPIPSLARIVAAGETPPSDTSDFVLARYKPFDRLDQTFGSSGFVFTPVPGMGVPLGSGRANSVRVARQGRIIAAGSVRSAGQEHFGVACYRTDGTLDPGFNSGAVVVTSFPAVLSEANAVVLDGHGGAVVAGTARRPTASIGDFAVARYSPDGRLDNTFSGDGRVVTKFPEGPGEALDVIFDGRGRIVVAGWAGTRFAVARYRTNGNLDTSFGANGRATAATPGAGASSGRAVHVKIIDETITVVGDGGGEFGVARFRENGSLDPSFGNGGSVRTNIGGSNGFSTAYVVTRDSQGRTVVAGITGPNDPVE